MRYPCRSAAEDRFIHSFKIPVIIVGEQLAAFPFLFILIIVRSLGYKRLADKNIESVDAIRFRHILDLRKEVCDL